ncbi:MAG: tetratricopeptide repeat protein [Verrucomicrobia bacterium]|nr:tetratricopeptide repeat protein [Verrucomicrobiota bacterium]
MGKTETGSWLQAHRAEWGVALFLLAVGVAVYLPVFSAGFIWDDDYHLTGNLHVLAWRGLLDIWGSRAAMYYPLTLTTFWGLHKVVGLHPLPYHLLTLLLHTANAFLVWTLLRELKIPGALLAACLFLVHPVQVESVAWITELKNTQSGFFTLLSFWCLVRSGLLGDHPEADGPVIRPRWYQVGWGFFALALLSKTAVVMLPAVGLIAMLSLERNWRRERLQALLPLFLLSMTAAAWTIWEQRYSSGASGFEWSHSFLERLALAGQVFWFYVGKLLWPFPVMFLYPRWPVGPVTPFSLLPLIGALLLMALPLLLKGDRARFLFLSVASFGLLVFPVLGLFNVYFFRYAYVADHFLYLAAIPLFALVAAALADLGVWFADRLHLPPLRLMLVIGGVACLPLAVGSHRHARTFQNPEALWTAAIAANPDAWMAHNNLALLYQNRGETERAREHYLAALIANPRHYEAMTNLGTLLLSEGRIGEARDLFRRAATLQPENPVHRVNVGYAEQILGNREEAEQHYRAALAERGDFAEGWLKLAVLLEEEQRIAEAIPAYREAFLYMGHPSIEQARYFGSKSEQALKRGKREQARLWLDEVDRLAPGLPEAKALRQYLDANAVVY